MNKKEIITLISLGIVNFFACLLLTIFALPNQIPVSYDIYEKVTSLSTKWIMILSSIIPLFFIFGFIFIKNNKVKYTCKILFYLAIYENVLFFIYFSVSNNIYVGAPCEIPLSGVIFMPIAVIITILSPKLKNAPYLSKPAFNFKSTRATEFIWKQTHFFAQKLYFGMGVLLYLISAVFLFIPFCIIETLIFFVIILVFTIIIYNYSYSLFDKYVDLKENQVAQKLKKILERTDNITDNNKSTETKSNNEKSNNNIKSEKPENSKQTDKNSSHSDLSNNDSINKNSAENESNDENLEDINLEKELGFKLSKIDLIRRERRKKRLAKEKKIDGSKLM